MLQAMFSGAIPVRIDETKNVFIDRNGKYFGKILNYLRNGSIEAPKSRSKVIFMPLIFQCYHLLKEAEFFQLSGLSKFLTEHLNLFDSDPSSPKKSKKIGKQVTVIKTEGERDALLKAINEPIVILEVTSSSFGEDKV
jgi:hypothetical protein